MSRASSTVSFGSYGDSAPENYERYFVPAIGTPFAIDLLDVAGLRPGERVLDVACGTGVVARFAAERVGADGAVAGLDGNPGMLAVARSVTPSGTSIEWHEASAEEMPLPDEVFDAVLSSLGLQFVPDKPAALREMQRVLVSGGRLAVNGVGPTPPMFSVLAEALTRHVKPDAAAFVEQVFSLYEPRKLEQLIDEAGFQDVAVETKTLTLTLPPPEEFLWQYVHCTPLVAAVAPLEEEARDALERDVVAGWQEFIERNALIVQLPFVVASARRK